MAKVVNSVKNKALRQKISQGLVKTEQNVIKDCVTEKNEPFRHQNQN